MNKLMAVLLLCASMLISGCAVSQSREATALQAADTNRPKSYRRFVRPRPFMGFPYPVSVVGGIGGVGIGGACP